MKSGKEKPLTVAVERGELVIRLGVNMLAHGVATGNEFHQYDDKKDEYIRNFAITDAEEFAKDVMHQIEKESETGSSPLSIFLDEMAQATIDDGCTGIDYDKRIVFGKRAKSETW